MNSDGTTIDNVTVQIRRKNESAWLTLGSPANLNPWTAKIAGTFEMRGIGTVDGKSVETPIAEVEVRFPEYSEITGDSSVSFLPEETAIEIARQSFAESPDATNPPPIVKREDSKTVVYLPRWRCPDSSPREFPKDWRPVWIDNATGKIIPSPASVLAETEALEIAKAELGNNYYDRQGKITVERNSTCFVFTFPFPCQGEPGTQLGPDFAFKVCVDSETKAVLFVEAGY